MPKLPGVNHLDAVRALEKTGFRIVRQGKHIVIFDLSYTGTNTRLARFKSQWACIDRDQSGILISK